MNAPAGSERLSWHGASPEAIAHVLRWLCEALVRQLLRGAWRFVTSREGLAQDRAFERFCNLVDAAPCWPCYVEYMHPRAMQARAMAGKRCWQTLLILSGAAADEAGDDFGEDSLS